MIMMMIKMMIMMMDFGDVYLLMYGCKYLMMQMVGFGEDII
jgi:hypothetical protein